MANERNTSSAPPRVAIWRAVSSRRQAVKISLSEQERLARDWADSIGGEVVGVLTVPGHSRRESDVLDLFEDYAKRGITAYHDLRQMWKQHAFDVLHAYDDSRFGRSATLGTYVMENTLLSGASIYYHEGGWLRQDGGFRYRIAVGSAQSAADIDKLVERSKMGKRDRAQKGLNNGSRPPISHNLIRDPITGKGSHLEVDESKRRLWDDLAELLLAGVAWEKLGAALYERGHANTHGKPYGGAVLYRLVNNPIFWGNQGLNYANAHRFDQRVGQWIFDPSAPRPDHVEIFYNTHEAVYTDEVGSRIQAELRRRFTIIKGKATSGSTRMFTGLLVCGNCWHTMETVSSHGWYGLRCGSRWKRRGDSDCPNTKSVPATLVREYFDRRIQKMLESENLADLDDTQIDQLLPHQIDTLRHDLDRLNDQMSVMIREQGLADDTLQDFYRREIRTLGRQASILTERLSTLEREDAEQEVQRADVLHALDDIRALTLEKFWQQEMRFINQTLYQLMGDRQIVAVDGELKGTAARRKWSRKPSV